MIGGVGVDVVDITAFREQLGDKASAFVDATFTPAERRRCASRPAPAASFAARFAAKEAFIKAWSTARVGLQPVLSTIDMREIETVHDAFGRPSISLSGAVGAALRNLSPSARVHLSLSHDGDVATAFVLLEL